MIARIYGLYEVKIEGKASVNIILMANTNASVSARHLISVFDLKGSTVNRYVPQAADGSRKTLKDTNLRQ